MEEIMFEKIMFCTDLSKNSDGAFPYALDLAKKYQSYLVIVHIIEQPPQTGFVDLYVTEDIREKIEKERLSYVNNEIESRYVSKMGNVTDYEVIVKESSEKPHYPLLEIAKEKKVDLIVIGTHGRSGIEKAIFGSVAERVCRRATCPVLTISSSY